MTLLLPIWLMLLFPLGACLFLFRLPTRLLRVLRATILLLVVLALCRPAIRLTDRSGTVVVVADRSESMPHSGETMQKEAVALVRSGMRARDELAVVSFGRRAAIEQPAQRGEFSGFINDVGSDQSSLADGLDLALTMIPRGTAARLLVISDGRWTGRDPNKVIADAAGRGIAVDYRMLERKSINDLAVSLVHAPDTVLPGESYIITTWISSPVAQSVDYVFCRGAQVLAKGSRKVAAGLNRLMFRDKADEPGTAHYTFSVAGTGEDPIPENNSARLLVGIEGDRPALCLTTAENSGFARLLVAGQHDIKIRTPGEARWSLEELSNYSSVLIENVQANDIGVAGMETIATWLEQTGSGLMMTGGKKSYGPGGYFRSPLERIMPVTMELRKEHRKLSLAIVVVLDRSGSMSMPAGGGRTKMDLADIGTVQVLDLLSDMDEIGVIAVDSQPHMIVDMNSVAVNRGQRQKILQIGSMGGGIFVYEGLSAAAKMLMKAQAGTRHIILFSDAADSEEPGAYVKLIENCRAAGITISVIGLGTRADCDAQLLEDIARLGEGQCYFTTSPDEIPRLFAQDTFTIARSAFIEDPTVVKFTGQLATLIGDLPENPPAIGGYNLCYARPDAMQAALTGDEYNAPVVAAWRAGGGRVLCFTAEADGEFAGPFAKWNKVGSFYSSLVRWTVGEPENLPERMLLTRKIRKGVCTIFLHLDPERTTEPFTGTPVVKLLRGEPGTKPDTEEVAMEWVSADLVAVDIQMRGTETLLPTVEIPGFNRVVMSPVCLPYSPEFEPIEQGRGEEVLARIAAATGGKERIDLAGIWQDLPRKRHPIEIARWLTLLAVVLVLVEVLQRRTGFLSRPQRRPTEAEAGMKEPGGSVEDARRPRRGKRQKVRRGRKPAGEPEAPVESGESKADEETDGMSTLDAMKRARQSSRRRMRQG
jgi:Mg-chelatase subunit ChlD